MSKTKIWCCTRKCFMSTKKVDVARNSVSCRQKQDIAEKNYFVLKKVNLKSWI